MTKVFRSVLSKVWKQSGSEIRHYKNEAGW